MILKNKLKKLIILTIILIIIELMVILDSQLYIWKLFNYIFPCKHELNSFPCYGKYSIYLFFWLLVAIFGLIWYILELKMSENITSKNFYLKIINIVWYVVLILSISLICWMIYAYFFLN